MSRRNIEMYEYRQVIILMRKGKSNRDIARNGLVSRTKAKAIRRIASATNWLDSTNMPTDVEISEALCIKSSSRTKILPFKSEIEKWHKQGISAVVVYRVLKEQYSFPGSYNAVQRFMKTLSFNPEQDATIILKFSPGECAQVDFGKGPIIFDKDFNKKIS